MMKGLAKTGGQVFGVIAGKCGRQGMFRNNAGHKTLVSRIIIAGWLGICLWLLIVPRARAGEGYLIYDAPNVNNYHLTVLARPNPFSVGKVHLLIRAGLPSGVSQETPVRGAQMLVQFEHLSGPGADKTNSYLQRRDLIALETEPGTYELDDSIQNEGVYRITLNLQQGPQKAVTSFEITARPEPDDRFFSVLLLSLFPIFLAWLIWMYLKRPGPPKNQTDQDSTTQSTIPETPAVAQK